MSVELPPGLKVEGIFTTLSENGSLEWIPFKKVKLYTNAFVRKDRKVLLGYKKRGFGKGLYNGFGGKIDVGETPAAAAARELEEEAGITASLEHRGTLLFMSTDIKEAAYIEVFYADGFQGTIAESEEMRPEWFAIPDTVADLPHPPNTDLIDEETGLRYIPYDQMWEDDVLWLPTFLSGRHFVGRADFGADGHLQRWWFGVRS